MTLPAKDMPSAMQMLLLEIKKDHARQYPESTDKFGSELRFVVNKKYIKVWRKGCGERGDAWGSVWGFVVNTDDDKKFKRGDILKAQGWNTPARNHARGNVFSRNYVVKWTGPLYMSDVFSYKKKKMVSQNEARESQVNAMAAWHACNGVSVQV